MARKKAQKPKVPQVTNQLTKEQIEELREEGRVTQRYFDTAQDLLDCFHEYLDICKREQKRPNKAGFFLHARISSETFKDYRKRYKGEGFDIISDQINFALQDDLIQDAFKNTKHQAMNMFLLKSQHQYSDRPGNNINVGIQNNRVDLSRANKEDLEKMRETFMKNRELEDRVSISAEEVPPEDD